jgi:hypothetical protein
VKGEDGGGGTNLSKIIIMKKKINKQGEQTNKRRR